MDRYLRLLWLLPLGFVTGAWGTLIGAGGGFVLAPALLLLYPGEAPEVLTSISLTVVFFNALSGTLAYARSKRIDYPSGSIFAAANAPGAVLGALATSAVSRARFNLLFGFLLILVAFFLTVKPAQRSVPQTRSEKSQPAIYGLNKAALAVGFLLSTVFGFLSSFLGIGGGFLYVPALVYGFEFPVRSATATSLFVLTITSLTGLATHIAAGLYHHGMRRAFLLSIGAVLGAQLGAKLSQHIRGEWILRGLTLALGLAGLRLFASALW